MTQDHRAEAPGAGVVAQPDPLQAGSLEARQQPWVLLKPTGFGIGA